MGHPVGGSPHDPIVPVAALECSPFEAAACREQLANLRDHHPLVHRLQISTVGDRHENIPVTYIGAAEPLDCIEPLVGGIDGLICRPPLFGRPVDAWIIRHVRFLSPRCLTFRFVVVFKVVLCQDNACSLVARIRKEPHERDAGICAGHRIETVQIGSLATDIRFIVFGDRGNHVDCLSGLFDPNPDRRIRTKLSRTRSTLDHVKKVYFFPIPVVEFDVGPVYAFAVKSRDSLPLFVQLPDIDGENHILRYCRPLNGDILLNGTCLSCLSNAFGYIRLYNRIAHRCLNEVRPVVCRFVPDPLICRPAG